MDFVANRLSKGAEAFEMCIGGNMSSLSNFLFFCVLLSEGMFKRVID